MGCSKNTVDSEVLLARLERGKFEVFHNSCELNFDTVIINTCSFINDAKQESIDMILDCIEAKKHGRIGQLYVMGCLSQRYRSDLEKEIPEVDRYFGKFDLNAITRHLNATLPPEHTYERKLTTPPHYAYLKISEGCNRSCAFCAIPAITGSHKSTPIDSLVNETRYLAQKGVKEILLIAQDTASYGTDIYGTNRLAELVESLSQVNGIEWVRLHYLHPTKFPLDILPVIRQNPKICKYIDIPLQHIANTVLKNMRRHITREETVALIKTIKQEIPQAAIRTTMLVGFPGETERDFEELKQFVEETKFDRLGVFTYSHEEGTYAAKKFSDNIPEEIKQARANEIMELQQQISAELNRQKTGQVLKAVIDRKEGELFVGRTQFDSPEVDGEVFISPASELTEGQLVNVRITAAEDYDLFGQAE